MADLRFEDKNNQKKSISVFASGEVTSANDGDTLFTLPAGSFVVSIDATQVDGGGAGNGDVTGIAADTYYATGATVVLDGATIAEAEKIIVVYVETELTNGQYTD
jgi:hypothetical protein